jgi:FMN-dependent NADH-azoreductase
MKKLLVIESSPRGEQSVSRKVTKDLVEKLKAKEQFELVHRDLIKNPLPHVDGTMVQAYYTPVEAQDARLKAAVAPSNAAVDELLAADVIVIGLPMWNFGLPSVLKAWIDHIVRAGRTFSFEGGQLTGLVKNKEVYLVMASGSVFSNGPFASYDFVVPYMKAVLGFIGVTNVHVVRAEGLNDPAAAAGAIEKAKSQYANL